MHAPQTRADLHSANECFLCRIVHNAGCDPVYIHAIAFKHEGEDRGMAFGPVWLAIAGDLVNAVDTDLEHFAGGYFPEFYGKNLAYDLAEHLGIECYDA